MPSTDTHATELLWYQPKRLESDFELRCGQDVLATVRFAPSRPLSWEMTNRHVASVEAEGARWTLSIVRHGFLGLKGLISVTGASAGSLDAGFFLLNGRLRIEHGSELRWRGGLMRRSSDRFEDLNGVAVLRLDEGSFFDRVNARVIVSAEAASGQPVVLLASLGLYLRLLMNKANQ